MDEAQAKTCSKCATEKPLVEFKRSSKVKSGYASVCLACNRSENRAYYGANKESVLAKNKAWAEANPEKMREYVRQHQRDWRLRDPSGYKAYMAKYRTPEVNRRYAREDYHRNREDRLTAIRAWRARNADICAALGKAWRELNKEQVRALSRSYKARKKNSIGTHSGEDIKSLLEAQKWKCAICKISVKNGYHVDHVIPLAKGGRNDKSNLQILCQRCNCRKHDKDPIAFARENGLLL